MYIITAAITKLHTAPLLLGEFWAVFTRLDSSFRVAVLHGFSVTLKRAVW
jgi:hypothetical protein